MKIDNRKSIIFSICIAVPVFMNAEGNNPLTDYDWKFLLVSGLATFVLSTGIFSLIRLNFQLIKLQQIALYGEEIVANRSSLWQRMKEKLTDMVPVEQEFGILLNHDYDGIQELDNNLPPWWLYGFYISIIFGFVYIGYFHYFKYGKNSAEEYRQEILIAEEEVAAYREKQANNINENELIALEDENSIKLGEAVFNNNCIACHLKGAGGSPTSVGPNLTDKYWLHGGDVISIYKTIKYGVPEKGMIAWKAQISPADMHRVASYIMSIQGTNPPNAKEAQGELFVYDSSLEEEKFNE